MTGSATVPTEEPNANRSLALILERGSPKPVIEIARVVGRLLNEPASDAAARVRYGAGLVAQGLDQDTVTRVSEALREIDVYTCAIPVSVWRTVPNGYKIQALEFGTDELVARMVTRRLVIPRRDVVALHLYGLVSDPTISTDGGRTGAEATGGSLAEFGRMAASTHSTPGQQLRGNLASTGLTNMGFRLTLHTPEPIGPLRISKDDFDFSSLGDRKGEHSLENFLTLLERLLEWAPAIWNGELARSFLETLDPEQIAYFKEDEAENCDRWIAQWVRLRAPAEGAAPAAEEGAGGGEAPPHGDDAAEQEGEPTA